VKYIAPFIYLIHGVDSEKLLAEINKQGAKLHRRIDCLLQVFIADEATKFGFNEAELQQIDLSKYPDVNVLGLMGMASFTDNLSQVSKEFSCLENLYSTLQQKFSSFELLSMGMSGDYAIALQEGSNMVRIGSLLFGQRSKA
ncbi:MAG: YggS family pyridoxal phosphate-dependent enzyme, partial [Chryseobacterium sp.]